MFWLPLQSVWWSSQTQPDRFLIMMKWVYSLPILMVSRLDPLIKRALILYLPPPRGAIHHCKNFKTQVWFSSSPYHRRLSLLSTVSPVLTSMVISVFHTWIFG